MTELNRSQQLLLLHYGEMTSSTKEAVTYEHWSTHSYETANALIWANGDPLLFLLFREFSSSLSYNGVHLGGGTTPEKAMGRLDDLMARLAWLKGRLAVK